MRKNVQVCKAVLAAVALAIIGCQNPTVSKNAGQIKIQAIILDGVTTATISLPSSPGPTEYCKAGYFLSQASSGYLSVKSVRVICDCDTVTDSGSNVVYGNNTTPISLDPEYQRTVRNIVTAFTDTKDTVCDTAYYTLQNYSYLYNCRVVRANLIAYVNLIDVLYFNGCRLYSSTPGSSFSQIQTQGTPPPWSIATGYPKMSGQFIFARPGLSRRFLVVASLDSGGQKDSAVCSRDMADLYTWVPLADTSIKEFVECADTQSTDSLRVKFTNEIPFLKSWYIFWINESVHRMDSITCRSLDSLHPFYAKYSASDFRQAACIVSPGPSYLFPSLANSWITVDSGFFRLQFVFTSLDTSLSYSFQIIYADSRPPVDLLSNVPFDALARRAYMW
jgi:hypothetical protein